MEYLESPEESAPESSAPEGRLGQHEVISRSEPSDPDASSGPRVSQGLDLFASTGSSQSSGSFPNQPSPDHFQLEGNLPVAAVQEHSNPPIIGVR
jgi:hypothetical protein